MKKSKLEYVSVVIMFVLLLHTVVVLAAVPPEISYQGHLAIEATGDPIPDGDYNFTFRLYETPGGGVPVWFETQTSIPVMNGLYSVMLGSVTPFDGAGIDFSRVYFLSVEAIAGPITFPEIGDRYQLSASPYALNLASLGAGDGQVLKWNDGAAKWEPGNDEIGAGGGVGGSGTDNFVPRWNGTADLQNSGLYQADGGNFGIGTTVPTARLEIEGAPGTGIIIDNPTIDGIYIESPTNAGVDIAYAGWAGLHTDSGNYGAYIENCESHGIVIDDANHQGIYIDSPGASGIWMWNPGENGVFIWEASSDGIYIKKTGHHGIEIDSASWAGIYISSPAANGIDISTSPTTVNGIKIFSNTASPPDTGLYIVEAGTGIRMGYASYNGVWIDSTGGHGLQVDYSAGYGVWSINSQWSGLASWWSKKHGLEIAQPDSHGIEITSPSKDGVNIFAPFGDGVEVTSPLGNCFICDGTPHRLFRVNNKCEIFGHSYNQYIVDSRGEGITTPVSATTARWLEHVGEARLTNGKCIVRLPQDFLEGVVINNDYPMQVFLTPYGDLGRYTVDRNSDFFTVNQIEGDPNATFAYRILARVWGKEDEGIEHVKLEDNIPKE